MHFKLLIFFRETTFDTLDVNDEPCGLNADASLAAQDCGLRVLNLHLRAFRSRFNRSAILVNTSNSYLLLVQTDRKEGNPTAPLSANFESTLKKERRARCLQRHSLNYGSWSSRWKSRKAFEHRFSSSPFLRGVPFHRLRMDHLVLIPTGGSSPRDVTCVGVWRDRGFRYFGGMR